jgi:hypothetical protein
VNVNKVTVEPVDGVAWSALGKALRGFLRDKEWNKEWVHEQSQQIKRFIWAKIQ